MKFRVWLAVACTVLFLFCNASAAGLSLSDLVTGGSQDSGISIPSLPPPTEGSVLERKILDTQPFIFKNSDRRLLEAEISRNHAKEEWEECMSKVTVDINNLEDTKQHGLHFSIDQVKEMYSHPAGDVGFYQEEICASALDDLYQANKLYRAALAATGDKDYDRQAKIFESAAGMYSVVGNTKAQEEVENAAMAARARAAAESLPLSPWIVVLAVIGGLVLARKKKN
jgi:hypothetical protein